MTKSELFDKILDGCTGCLHLPKCHKWLEDALNYDRVKSSRSDYIKVEFECGKYNYTSKRILEAVEESG